MYGKLIVRTRGHRSADWERFTRGSERAWEYRFVGVRERVNIDSLEREGVRAQNMKRFVANFARQGWRPRVIVGNSIEIKQNNWNSTWEQLFMSFNNIAKIFTKMSSFSKKSENCQSECVFEVAVMERSKCMNLKNWCHESRIPLSLSFMYSRQLIIFGRQRRNKVDYHSLVTPFKIFRMIRDWKYLSYRSKKPGP